MNIGFSGVRALTSFQAEIVEKKLTKISSIYERCVWHVGDATGVDAIARRLATEFATKLVVYTADNWTPWELQQRSKRMVDALSGGVLVAFPNKPCPARLTPWRCDRWYGSGTWGTVAYAIRCGVRVELYPLTDEAIAPAWLIVDQLSLF
jgi:hypothetical protein